MSDYILASKEEEYAAASELFKQYAAWLNIDLSFQNFDEELEGLNKMYTSPDGGIILCRHQYMFIACVAVRRIDGQSAELKRMFVQDEYKRKGIGKSLLQRAINLARQLGYKKMRLDTLNHMLPAINLYKGAGFYEVDAYYNNPNEGVIYLERLI